MMQLEEKLQSVSVVVQMFFVGFTEVVQRALIIGSDLVLILWAAVAESQDWAHSCEENLHFYGFLCVLLCVLDMAWEFIRCSLESSLDRLQRDFKASAPNLSGNNEEGLLGDSPFGSPKVSDLETSPTGGTSKGSLSAGAVGYGIRKEKALRRKRTSDLQFWSIVFTTSVAIIFSFFSAHDEECSERVPSLYSYVHIFTYVYIFRLGALVLWVCCRTVKNYEDAALAAGGLSGDRQQQAEGTQMAAAY